MTMTSDDGMEDDDDDFQWCWCYGEDDEADNNEEMYTDIIINGATAETSLVHKLTTSHT